MKETTYNDVRYMQITAQLNSEQFCDWLKYLSIDIVEKTYGIPVNPCKHSQCILLDLQWCVE